jgi:hypothetical protein
MPFVFFWSVRISGHILVYGICIRFVVLGNRITSVDREVPRHQLCLARKVSQVGVPWVMKHYFKDCSVQESWENCTLDSN